MSSFLINHPRRQFLAAGVLLWTSLTLCQSQCVEIKDLRVACIATKPTHTYRVSFDVTNLMDCTVPWITLHPAMDFSPNIINLTTPLATGDTTTITTTLNGPVPGTSYTFTLLAHCLREGQACDPCRQEIKIDLPHCDPQPEPMPTVRPMSPSMVGLEKDRFYLRLPQSATQRYIIEASQDMVHWQPIATSASPDGASTMEAVQTNAPNKTVWIKKLKAQRGSYFRVREAD
ncbi:MAG: hypothetical protein ACI8T1_003053 [Verrucomicrobiales bacterium]|jgi:hypothetical protein